MSDCCYSYEFDNPHVDYNLYSSNDKSHSKYYSDISTMVIDKYQTINYKGSINTVTKWLMDAVYDVYKN
mgnify:CR=1 FL=1